MRDKKYRLFYGYVDADVSAAMEGIRNLLKDDLFVWIKVLDSTPDPAVILKSIARIGVVPVSSGPVVVTLRSLDSALSHGLFSGFDEVWFFKEQPGDLRPFSKVVLTTDSEQLRTALPESIASPIQQSGCVLALGDGDGLNYIASQEAIDSSICSRFGPRD